MRKYGSDSNSQTRGGVSNIMPLSQSDVKDIRALNLPHVLSRGSSHQVKRVIASHSEYQITSLPLFQAHSNGVVSFQMPKSRSDLSSGHLCFLRFSLCHFCVIFRQNPCGSACCGLVCGSPCGSPMWGANFAMAC